MELADVLVPSGTTEEVHLCGIYVDEEGDWFYQGNKIIREDIIEFFYQNLHISPDGRFLIEWQQNQCVLETADTPFVISRVDRKGSGGAGEEEIVLTVRHFPGPELLDANTLKVGKDNILYCRIQGGRFPARFSRPAYYQLAEWVQENPDTGSFYLEINGMRYPIQ